MATYKVTMIFSMNKTSWTESWYWDNAPESFTGGFFTSFLAGFPPTVPSELTNWAAAFQARCALLADQAVMEAVRFSDEAAGHATDVYTFTKTFPNSGLPRDVRRRSIKGEARAEGNRYRRTVTLGGVPDEFVNFLNDGRPDYRGSPLGPLWENYSTAVRNAAACIKAIGGAPQGHDWQEVTGVVGDTDGFALLRVPGHGYGVNDKIRVKGVKLFDPTTAESLGKPLDGVFYVQQPKDILVTTPANYIRIGRLLPQPSRFAGPGKADKGRNTRPGAWVQLQVPFYPLIERLSSDDLYFGQRKRVQHGPFEAARGRSSAITR